MRRSLGEKSDPLSNILRTNSPRCGIRWLNTNNFIFLFIVLSFSSVHFWVGWDGASERWECEMYKKSDHDDVILYWDVGAPHVLESSSWDQQQDHTRPHHDTKYCTSSIIINQPAASVLWRDWWLIQWWWWWWLINYLGEHTTLWHTAVYTICWEGETYNT